MAGHGLLSRVISAGSSHRDSLQCLFACFLGIFDSFIPQNTRFYSYFFEYTLIEVYITGN